MFTEMQFIPPAQYMSQKTIYGLLGILTIQNAKHLVVIKERSEVFRVEPLDQYSLPQIVFELSLVEFIPFDMRMTKEKIEDAKPILEKIAKYITYGTFFGFQIDLTRSMQVQTNSEKVSSDAKFGNVDTRYMWNYAMCKDLINQGIKKHWCIPLI